ncbi:hypothetical protein SADUNF_Sadunf04G0044700 [Salix dunnii]|uniref:Uncharacterized protein n=1 Tax=Salix dunnii TaxID=1413687 RepID=A0A835K5Z1_9ROSI|nr:hypothetical protein SADUNF_Sadunf04G0044700 [Salix dunnii]
MHKMRSCQTYRCRMLLVIANKLRQSQGGRVKFEPFTSPFQWAVRCEPPYNLGTTRGASQSVTMWWRLISFSERQPLKAIVSSNSSRSI